MEETGQRRAACAFKIIILGESNVGKTSLFVRYTQDAFRDAIANTIGIDNKFKELFIDGSPVHLQMWDTAGQERFRAIVSAYYREADGFFFVYDVTMPRSYDYMVRLLDELKPSIDLQFAVLVGNKIDAIDPDRLAEEEERLSALAKRMKCVYGFTSAKTGANVNGLFEDLARNLFYRRKKPEQKTWLDITHSKPRRKWCFR